MKVEILSESFIKPSVPTPPTLRHYKIAFTDELSPIINVHLILFYSAMARAPSITNYVDNRLERSLERALTWYYPLAGRYISETHTVHCNDAGVRFMRATVNMKLQEILDNPQVIRFNDFIPTTNGAVDSVADPMLSTQATVFECGGLALGICVSHRIVDASTFITFLNDWATFSRGNIDDDDQFNYCSSSRVGRGFKFMNAASYFPGRGLPSFDFGIPRVGEKEYVAKRLWFREEAISNMRRAVNGGRRWSKVRLVTALMWKALARLDCAKNGGRNRASIILVPANLRGKTRPPIPENCCGNLWGFVSIECTAEDSSSKELGGFSDLYGDAVKKTVEAYGRLGLESEELKTMVMNSFLSVIMSRSGEASKVNNHHAALITSWCGFKFHELDFGGGKPVWINLGTFAVAGLVILMDDAQGDGVEAFVFLDADDIPILERDNDILIYSV